jgi:hypothetical protein
LCVSAPRRRAAAFTQRSSATTRSEKKFDDAPPAKKFAQSRNADEIRVFATSRDAPMR